MSGSGIMRLVCLHLDRADLLGEGTDHIQAVYGWTREAAIYSARVCLPVGSAHTSRP